MAYINLPNGWKVSILAEVVAPVVEKERVEQDKEYHLAGVKWYGEGVFHREDALGKKLSAAYLTPLQSNALIYNRLFAWKASFAVVPEDLAHCHVSSEFPQFLPNAERLDPFFLYLYMILPGTIDAVNRASIGSAAVSRNRYKEEDFLSLRIPLPPLPVQRAIVGRWRAAQEAVVAASDGLKRLAAELDQMLWTEYWKQASVDVIHQRFLGVNWSDAEAWDMKSARAAAFRLACSGFVPMSAFAEEATELARPMDEPDKEWPVFGVNNNDGVFLNCHQKGREFNAPYKRIRRDWFFHNPTRANVGSLGIVPEVPEDAVTSPEYQVWRIRDETPPGYVATLINTSFFLELVQFHRVGAVKQRLYIENLLSIPVPPIPRENQEMIATERIAALTKIEKAKQQAEIMKIEVEAMILGAKPVPSAIPGEASPAPTTNPSPVPLLQTGI